ncbi:dermonecrotic toxin domain-containing protein [Pseudomonas sp. DC3200b2]|uniref:dermonecrotic toxin domain-containing protein n=1 Tax=Pseudomonas sp. DC3200b2 TaxID=2804669 RepID=UPI003CE7B4AA
MSLSRSADHTAKLDFIRSRLPTWLATASAPELERFEALNAEAEQARRTLQLALEGLPQYELFAAERLRAILMDLGEHAADPATAVLHWVDPDSTRAPSTCTLVQAVLRNFSEQDAKAEAFGPGSGLFRGVDAQGQPVAGSQLSIAPHTFAAACRVANVGEHFAQALAAALPLDVPAGPADRLAHAFMRADRANLTTEACIAKLQGRIDGAGEQLLANWIFVGPKSPLPAKAQRLVICGFSVSRALVITARPNETANDPCLLYIPNDPYAPLAQFPNLASLWQALDSRLGHPAYVRFLAGYVGLAYEDAFIKAIEGDPTTLLDHYGDLPANPLRALELAERLLERQPVIARDEMYIEISPLEHVFTQRYSAWARQTLDDAQVTAVSTERIDRQASLARHQKWIDAAEQLGLLVLSVIPGVGEIVAVYSMVQTVRGFCELSAAWAADDERRIRALMIGAAENARFMVPASGGTTEAENEAFLARLQLVACDDGQVRLWPPHLPRSAHIPFGPGHLADNGLMREGGQAWVYLDNQPVPVRPNATAYIARPLTAATQRGYMPCLLGNGEGGWRAAYERPSQWTPVQLLRRAWGPARDLPDEALDLVHRLSGLEDTALQGLVIRGEPLPALSRYLLRRRQCALRLQRFASRLRSEGSLPEADPGLVRLLANVPGWPAQLGIELRSAAGDLLQLHPERLRSVKLSASALARGDWVESLFRQMSSQDIAGLGLGANADSGVHRLAAHWADVLSGDIAALLDELSEPPAAPGAQDGPHGALARQFPKLPGSMVQALIQGCTTPQRERLALGRVPVALAEQAVQQLRHLRIARAREALDRGYVTPDRDALLCGFLADLPQWPANLALELREAQPDGPLVHRVGAVGSEPLIVVRRPGGYQAVHDHWRGPVDNRLEEAVLALVRREWQSARLPWKDAAALRGELSELAMSDSGRVRRYLNMTADTRPYFRPPTRLLDGRRGYALSGRGRGAPITEDDLTGQLLRELYPEANGETLRRLRLEIGSGPMASAELARRQADLVRLRSELDSWRGSAGAAGALAIAPTREIAIWLIVQAWQRRFPSTRAMPSDRGVRYGLNLSYLNTGGSLPRLSVSFPHILELSLSDMGLQRIDPEFLACFPNARILRIEENPLHELPHGPAWLGQLREIYLRDIGPDAAGQVFDWLQPSAGTLRCLDLSSNPAVPNHILLARLEQFQQLRLLELTGIGLELTAATRGVFRGLPNLEALSLNRNPLAFAPDLEGMTQLNWLSIQSSGLQALPPGLVSLMQRNDLRLTYVNLSGNDIHQLPDLRDSTFFRRAQADASGSTPEFILDENPLDPRSVSLLHDSGFRFIGRQAPGAALEPARSSWLDGCPQELAERILTAQEERAAQPFYDVLSQVVRTAPYLRADNEAQRLEVRERAWHLAERLLRPEDALPGLDELRERLYQMATDARATCGDGVVLTLDQFESEVRVWEAIARSTDQTEEGPLIAALGPARQVFRQALLDGQAQRLIRARQARLNRTEPTDSATDLDDDIADHLLEMSVDEVELRLLLRQRLQARLDLPPVSERLYDAIIGEETLQRVASRVQVLDSNEAFAQWLVNHQATLRQAVEHRYADSFERAREPYDQALAYVLARAAAQEPEEPLSAQGATVLEAAEPAMDWRSAETPHPALTERQAYDLSNRLAEACNTAVAALRLHIVRRLVERADSLDR